jgi:hypothetical protein
MMAANHLLRDMFLCYTEMPNEIRSGIKKQEWAIQYSDKAKMD